MTTTPLAICLDCTRLLPSEPGAFGYRCEAFPEGIPQEILDMVHDHRRPWPGDDGIRFEPKPGSKVSPDPSVPIPWMSGEE